MRDKIKTKEYFDEYIQRHDGLIEKTDTSLERGEIKPDRIKASTRFNELMKLRRMVARYSRGDSIESLIGDYVALVEKMPTIEKVYTYEEYEWLLTIGIMLGIDDDTFRILSDHVLNSEHKEAWMLRFYIHSRFPEVEYKGQYLHKLLQSLRDLIESDNPSTELKGYLSRWYSRSRGRWWYDTHNSKSDSYIGYWCFEVGAIVKIMGLDDSEIKDNKYYPYDLVHFKD